MPYRGRTGGISWGRLEWVCWHGGAVGDRPAAERNRRLSSPSQRCLLRVTKTQVLWPSASATKPVLSKIKALEHRDRDRPDD